MINRFWQRNCRLTPQRVAIIRLLAESDGYPSAAHLYEQIKEQFPTTSPATVYKTLAVLKEMGEVLELGSLLAKTALAWQIFMGTLRP